MDVLTRERAKPALPFAGVHQLVDFPLSNLTHSGISDVWLSLQFQGSTLQEQVANGRPWDLDRNIGGLRILLPHEGTGGMDEEGFARGNADELFRFRDEMAAFEPDVVLVMSADHVYRLDYNDVLDAHRERRAECTVVVVRVARGRRPRRPRRRRDRRGRPDHRLRLQARRAGHQHHRRRGDRLRRRGAARGARGAAPRARGRPRQRRRATPASVTSATTCCPAGRPGPHLRPPARGLLARPRPAAPLPAGPPRGAHRRP